MKKLVCLIIILVCFPLIAANAKLLSLDINGVSGKVLANVEKRLNELQELKPLSEISPDELRNQIIKAIQPFGYFKADVALRIVSHQKISITIYPGPQIHISSLKVELTGEGSQNPILLKTVKQLPLHVGSPLFTELYNQAKQSLVNTAENLGYLHGTFQKAEILVDENKNTAAITLIFDTGPLYYFGQVQFDPTNIDPALLHRFVPFKEGQAYSTDQILKFNNYLSNSGYFSSVLVKPQISDVQSVPVLVHLQPVSKYTYTLGAGYGTDTGVRGRAGLNIIPVNRQGHKFNALAQGSFTQNALQAQYIVPGKNPVADQYSLTGNFSSLNYNSGYSNAFLLSLAQQHNVEHFKRVLSVNGLYESFHYSLQPNTEQFMLYPKAAFTFNNTTNPLFSPSGYSITLNGLGASHLTLSKISFAQTSIDAKAAFMIEPWRLRLYGHTIQGVTATSNINQLPLSLALLLGGTDNLKAFSLNSIGPGKIITYSGFEIQKEVKKNWFLVGFVDSGDVYNPVPRNIRYDAGGGLMWVSPIGPIKIGLAQAVTNRLQREGTNPRLVISMGPDL
ncbi:autotransporter assembly complex protein TamA [Legionella maioricensis]|uniref:Translocation and assembly module subunit TamA n=1 Tax=Legionella maioricensis TaxID=2896528 RepID=A0A9X2CXE0_9GAMM|nr:BamA/TamA family outer membrane protein [Legionella maioricensis]MCL9682514.1 BamA/TamA family outer membrane protein [Legionella maioricensis]MCL9686239.1 BamA/TamA family outer membrane protein [Legionella maioricensis]